MTNIESNTENVVIVGGGPAGMSAALYAARAGLEPLVFAGSPYGGQLTLTTEVENFPGIKSIMGPQLIENMREQIKELGTRVIDKNVLSIDMTQRPFVISYDKTGIKAQTLIIALGAKALWLNIDSEQRLRGKGVSACATCDGFFFRNKVVAVVGGGDTAMEEALVLTKFATKVYLIHRRDEFRASAVMVDRVRKHEKIEIIPFAQVSEVLGDQKVEGVRLESTKEGVVVPAEIELQGLFIAIGHKPDTDLVRNSLVLTKHGYVYTHAIWALDVAHHQAPSELSNMEQKLQRLSTMTSVDGVFAAGDCVDSVYRQAAVAAGMGVMAALDAQYYLEDLES